MNPTVDILIGLIRQLNDKGLLDPVWVSGVLPVLREEAASLKKQCDQQTCTFGHPCDGCQDKTKED